MARRFGRLFRVSPCARSCCLGSYTAFYCYGEPPPHRDEIVRSAVIVLNTLFWPSLVGLGFAATYSVRRWDDR